MKRRIRMIGLLLVLLAVVASVPAGAHEATIEDADDSDGTMDIRTVYFAHGRTDPHQGGYADTVTFLVYFHEPHGLPSNGGGVIVDLRPDHRGWGRQVRIVENRGGGYFAEVVGGWDFHLVGFGRVDLPNDDAVLIEIHEDLLPPRTDVLKWRIRAAHYDNDMCPSGEAGSSNGGHCNDIVPGPTVDDRTWIKHNVDR